MAEEDGPKEVRPEDAAEVRRGTEVVRRRAKEIKAEEKIDILTSSSSEIVDGFQYLGCFFKVSYFVSQI